MITIHQISGITNKQHEIFRRGTNLDNNCENCTSKNHFSPELKTSHEYAHISCDFF